MHAASWKSIVLAVLAGSGVAATASAGDVLLIHGHIYTGVHKAPWVLIDEVLDSLDDKALERAIDIFTKDLAQSGIIYIGRTDAHHVFTRVLHLIMDPTAKKLKALGAAPPATPPGTPPAAPPATPGAAPAAPVTADAQKP